MSSKTYSPRRTDVTVTSALKAATLSPSRSRNTRRPALIPAASFNALESTEDLSSILPEFHGLQDGGSVYLLPPSAPPAGLALELEQQQQQQQQQQQDQQELSPPQRETSSISQGNDSLEVDTDGDWTMSGAQTPVPPAGGLPKSGAPVVGSRRSEGTIAQAMRRWSMKDLLALDADGKEDEETRFATLKQYIHKRESSSVSEDLWSWVNAAEAEAASRKAEADESAVQDFESLPTSPMSSSYATRPDIQGQLERLQQATRVLNEL
ncbi:hypothetical protein Dda_7272 [Drechslerella dactyloides]|uniref:Uncharacterized protein n=1 Tax=Drechslerella dactyloides TaxID=74499 RepID=A0AAD6IW54_DREDA|nr:hypothetical protein Dda_7272 [Drechslerella dactyloides]